PAVELKAQRLLVCPDSGFDHFQDARFTGTPVAASVPGTESSHKFTLFTPRRAPGAETCINRAATVKFTLSQLLPTIGRRAGNIPASDPDTHPDLPRSRDQCRHKRKRQDPAVGPWRESAPTPIQLSRARRGVWKAPAH